MEILADIDNALEQFEEIDFSLILKESFYVTIDCDNRLYVKKGNLNVLMASEPDKTADEQNAEDDELDIFAGIIVSGAAHIPRSLFCPFCSNEYMFEFTLKDHLKRFHPVELEERLQLVQSIEDGLASNHSCPFCGAIFYLIGLLPKHITNFHGSKYLQHWRHTGENLHRMIKEKENEPSIIYASCSPGLSEIFDKLGTDGQQPNPNPLPLSFMQDTQQRVKSILKKTPSKSSRIINSPSGVAIRRSKSELVKRSISVRRELRFDLPPLQKSPEQTVVRKYRKFLDLKTLFRRHRTKTKKSKNDSPKAPCKEMVTSTPINFLEEDCDCDAKPIWRKKHPNQQVIRPLLFSSERYQCARCKQRYTSNGDLVMHLKDTHAGVRNILRPHYQCGQCGITFFRNSYLIRHCRFHHTPQKARI